MSAPQPPTLVDAAPRPKRPASSGGLVVTWLAWGVIAGITLPALLVVFGFVLGFVSLGAGFIVYLGLPLMPVGAVVGGTLGVLAGAVAVIVRTRPRPTGYGPALLRQPKPVRTRVLLSAWLVALSVAWTGFIVFATGHIEAFIVIGVVAAFVGVALTVAGVAAIRHARLAAVTAIALGPILALIGVLATVGASSWVASNPQPTIAEELPLVQGSPPGGPTLSEPEDSSRIPAPPPLYGDSTLDGYSLGYELEEAARYSLMIAQVDDPDIPAGTAFPASFVYCAWDAEGGVMQATTDIWFDTADDAAAIQRVREYWTTNGYTLVVDDPDLVVVAGAAGMIGAQYSIETTWDDELRLRMQSVCLRG